MKFGDNPLVLEAIYIFTVLYKEKVVVIVVVVVVAKLQIYMQKSFVYFFFLNFLFRTKAWQGFSIKTIKRTRLAIFVSDVSVKAKFGDSSFSLEKIKLNHDLLGFERGHG